MQVILWSLQSIKRFPRFARIAAPLSCKLEKDEPFQLGRLNETGIEALETLHYRLPSRSILSLTRWNIICVLDTDACDKQARYILLQQQLEGPTRPVRYWSQSLEKTRQAYDKAHRESFAVLWAVLVLRPYFEGSRSTTRASLHVHQLILNARDAPGKLARWSLQMLDFDFKFLHCHGVKHQANSVFSHSPTTIFDKS